MNPFESITEVANGMKVTPVADQPMSSILPTYERVQKGRVYEVVDITTSRGFIYVRALDDSGMPTGPILGGFYANRFMPAPARKALPFYPGSRPMASVETAGLIGGFVNIVKDGGAPTAFFTDEVQAKAEARRLATKLNKTVLTLRIGSAALSVATTAYTVKEI